MTQEHAILYFAIFLFSGVQSIFGVGLLLFGTPTLLLLGYPYADTLWILLPASVTISIIQVIRDYTYIGSDRRVYLFTVPPLAVCLVFTLVQRDFFDITKVIGAALLFVGFIRYSSNLKNILTGLIERHIKSYCIFMGAVHGFSNMGGGLLSVLMTTIYKEKYAIRTNIALVYLIFVVSQLCVLAFISPNANGSFDVWVSIVALLSYLTVGRFLARKINDSQYQEWITGVILVYGLLLIV